MHVSRRAFAIFTMLGIAGSARLSHAQGGKTVALLFDGLYSEFWVAGLNIMKAELTKRGHAVLEAISDQDDNKQFEQVRAMIARKVDGIVLVQTDAKAVAPSIRAAKRANIPLVHFNRAPADNQDFSVSVVADNRKIAREAVLSACQAVQRRGGRHKAAVLMGHLGDNNAIARRDGFQDAVSQFSDTIEVVARIPTEWNADKAFAGLTNALQASPDIDFIFTSSDFLLPQITQALRSANKWAPIGQPNHVTLTGFDGFPAAYELMASKHMEACGVQNLFLEAELALQAITDMQAGKKPDSMLLDPGFAITQENMEQRKNEMWGYTLLQGKAG